MAADLHLGEWRGNVTNGIVPTTTFEAVPGALSFEIINTSNKYSFNYTDSTLTLPSSGLADGYLMIAAFEYEDTSNGRAMLNGRILQTSGTGDDIAPITGGYNRDNSDDRTYVRTWAFVNNPSASSTFQFQWRRDVDAPSGGTVRAVFEVISFFYDSVSLYSSNSTLLYGGITPNQIQSFTTVTEGSGATRSGNVVTLNNNKRYLCLGAGHAIGSGNSRTQRWLGFRQNGTKIDYSKGYYYIRNDANSSTGAMFSCITGSTGSTTMDMFSYRGDGVAAGEGGADNDGGTLASAEYYMAFIELNNNTNCIQYTNGTTTTNVGVASVVDLPSFNTSLVNNSGSYFTNIGANSSTTLEAAKDFTILSGSNVSSAAETVSTGVRFTGYAHFFRATTLQNETFHGNYARNNQGSTDTFGQSYNLCSTTPLTTGETFKIGAQTLSTSSGDSNHTIQSGWHGTWGIALESMPPVNVNARRIISIT